jgi:hypothetical protein
MADLVGDPNSPITPAAIGVASGTRHPVSAGVTGD